MRFQIYFMALISLIPLKLLCDTRQLTPEAVERESVVQSIVTTYAPIGNINLITKTIKKEEYAAWFQMMEKVGNYVKENEPQFQKLYRKIFDLGSTLLNTLKINYNQNVSGKQHFDKEKISRFIIDALSSARTEIAPVVKTIDTGKKETEKQQKTKPLLPTQSRIERYQAALQKKLNVYTVLNFAARYLQVTLNKAFSDLDKFMKATN